MAKVTFVAKGEIRGIYPRKDGVEHVLEAGKEITLDSDHPDTVALVARGALVAKPAKAEAK